MKKAKRNTKQVKLLRRILMIFSASQIVIFALFFLLLRESRPIEISDCQSARIVIDDKSYERVYGEYRCRIFHNGIQYDFANMGRGEYSARELYENLEFGNEVNISYVNKYSIFGKYYLIVDARDDKAVYFNFDLYNSQKEKAFCSVIVLFFIIELFLVIVGFWILIINRRDVKSKSNRK